MSKPVQFVQLVALFQIAGVLSDGVVQIAMFVQAAIWALVAVAADRKECI